MRIDYDNLTIMYKAEYKAWWSARDRCHNPRSQSFRLYGARGIAMCEEWRRDFSTFFKHVGPKPSRKHSLDRIDNSRGYEPGNCRWATQSQQRYNSRNYMLRLDFTGYRFGMLTALLDLPPVPNRQTKWLCRCDCGRQAAVSVGHLRNGHTKSCGCLKHCSRKVNHHQPSRR